MQIMKIRSMAGGWLDRRQALGAALRFSSRRLFGCIIGTGIPKHPIRFIFSQPTCFPLLADE